jgi:hypothetical protein
MNTNNMKKYLLILALILVSFISFGQVKGYTVTGTVSVSADSLLIINGDTIGHFYTITPNDTVVSKSYVDGLFQALEGGHDPVTLNSSATNGGLSLTGQQLSFQQANGSYAGYVSSADWQEFNDKLSYVAHDGTLKGNGTDASPLSADTSVVAMKDWVESQNFVTVVQLDYDSLTNTPVIPEISNIAYGASWNGNLDGASKNTIYDVIEALGGVGTDLSYNASATDGEVTSSTGTDATIPAGSTVNASLMLPADKTKLDGVATGAEVNVNADWDAVSGDAEILNKPDLGSYWAKTEITTADTTRWGEGVNLWVEDADGINYDASGNVGIGRTSETFTQLSVQGDNTETGIYVSSSSGTGLWVTAAGVAEAGLFYATDANGIGVQANGGKYSFSATGEGIWHTVTRASTPSTPLAGNGVWYVKDDGKMYFLNESGTEYDLTSTGVASETDPVFINSLAYDITETDTVNWNAAYGWGDHSTEGYLTEEVDGSVTNELQTLSIDSVGRKFTIDISDGNSVTFEDTNTEYDLSSYDTHVGDGTIHYTQGSISIPASQISDFDTEVSNNTDVAANTSARHNAVTLGTANGLSLSTQQLSLGLASTSTTGALSFTNWNTFNNKQAALVSGTNIKTVNSNSLLGSGNISIAPMVYPGAGIPVSTGSAWGTSITNNSTNWNTAYTYSQVGHVPLSTYTASDVLNKIKTVDGSGSGLDADLLDGLTATSFLRANASSTLTAAILGSDAANLLTILGGNNAYIGSTAREQLTLASIFSPRYRDGSDTYHTIYHSGIFSNNSTNWNTAYTYSQVGHLPLSGGELSGNVTAPEFVGALSGNATTATTLATSRTIWGQSFNGSDNVSGPLSGATTGAFSQSITIGATSTEDALNVIAGSTDQRLIRLSHPTAPTAAAGYLGFSNSNVGLVIGVQFSNIYYDAITIDRSTRDVSLLGTIQATTAKLTNLSDGYIPYHVSDTSGLANSIMSQSGSVISVAGKVTAENFQGAATQVITYSATPTMNWNSGNNGQITLTGHVTTLTLSNVPDGGTGSIAVVQNGTGGYGVNAIAHTGLTVKYLDNNPPTAANINSAANGLSVVSYQRLGSYLIINYAGY